MIEETMALTGCDRDAALRLRSLVNDACKYAPRSPSEWKVMTMRSLAAGKTVEQACDRLRAIIAAQRGRKA